MSIFLKRVIALAKNWVICDEGESSMSAIKKSKKAYSRTTLYLSISAILAACGGSGGSGGGGGGGGSNADPTEPVTLSGTASKGIILNGDVNAYPITDTGVDRENSVADPTTTDTTDGSYTLTLNESYDGGPIFIEVTANANSEMICDLQSCGDGIGFGDVYPLASDFSLSAAVPDATGEDEVSVNVTALTDAAAGLTVDRVEEGADPEEAAAASNAQVANLFGVTGDLTEQEVVDITNAEAVASADGDALEYNLTAAAIVSAGVNSETSVEEALDDFVEQYIGGGLAETETEETSDLTIEEILEESLTLLDEIEAEAADAGVEIDVTALETAITAEEMAAEEGSTEQGQGDVPDNLGSEGLVASKAFVQQLRDLGNASASDGLNAFADQVDLAGEFASENVEYAVRGAAYVMEGIAAAADNYLVELEEGVVPTAQYQFESLIIAVAVDSTTDEVSFSVDQTIEVFDEAPDGTVTGAAVDLDIAATIGADVVQPEDETASSGEYSADVAFSIEGTSVAGGVTLTIEEGTVFADVEGTFDETETQNEGGITYDDEETNILNELSAALVVSISQAAVEDGGLSESVTFTGRLGLSLEGFSEELDETETESENGYSFEETEAFSLGAIDFSLVGTFGNESGDSLEASFAATADGTGLTENCTFALSENFTTGESSYEDSCDNPESESDFASLTATVVFDLDLDGIEDDINVSATATRTGLDSGELDVELSYGGTTLDFEFDGEDTVTATNESGVTLTVTETELPSGEFEVSGELSFDGEVFGTIDDDAGITIITYSDGTFETL